MHVSYESGVMYAFLCFLWWVPICSYTIYIQCVVLVCSHMYALMFLCSSDLMFLYVLMFLCSTHISCIYLNFRSSSLDLRSSKFAFSLKHYTYALSGVWAMDGPPRGPAMGVSNCCGLASSAWGCLGRRVAVERSPWRVGLPLHDCVLSQIYASRGAPQASRGGWLRRASRAYEMIPMETILCFDALICSNAQRPYPTYMILFSDAL